MAILGIQRGIKQHPNQRKGTKHPTPQMTKTIIHWRGEISKLVTVIVVFWHVEHVAYIGLVTPVNDIGLVTTVCCTKPGCAGTGAGAG